MGTFSRFVVALVLLVVILGGIFGYKFYQIGQMQAQFSQPQPATVVDAVEVGTVTWQPSIKSVGSTRAINGIEVANELPGVVEKLMFESGQRVEAGDELVRLDSAIDEAALTTRRAEAMLASKEYQRNADLISRRAVSQSAVDETQAAMETAKARVQEAEAQLGKKVLKAPFDGVLGLRLVDLGEYLPAGTPIVEINMLDPILVQYTLSERELSNVEIGDTVEVSVAALPNESFKGKVSAINSSVTAESRTVQLRAELANADQRLKPGMFATIETLAEDERSIVAIPNTAIAFNTYGNFAYVLIENDEGQLVTERRTIETGSMRDGMTEVTKGLEVGERIVSTGLLRLRAGQPVQIKQAQAEAAPASAGAQ
ncbi:efflux RND transporter periplasmic adaptor subunit [Allohahella marinimesophila]|uniref:MexH family multidrug efflux RND transporter periplasmic adaptor subunit n=1 Tax=Allohahella marinimesophila TaxID=1054972 RepID=A0ABP7PCT1_9GAMM